MSGSGPGPTTSGWHKPVQRVIQANRASGGFRTLRDMVAEDVIDRGRLVVERHLGEGSFAHVYMAALDRHRQVAVKMLRSELLEDRAALQLFLEESKLLRRLRHSHVVEFLGVGEASAPDQDDTLQDVFLVQEYCAGGSLYELVYRQMFEPTKKLYSERHALTWCIGVAKALAYLHTAQPKVGL